MHKCKVLSVLVNLLSVAHVIIVTGRSDGRTDGHIDFYSAPPPLKPLFAGIYKYN